MIASHHCSPMLFNKRLITLDMTGVVAGTKYRGQFEERMKMLVKELEQNPDIIIFIDEIHTMIGAGSAAGTMDAANILRSRRTDHLPLEFRQSERRPVPDRCPLPIVRGRRDQKFSEQTQSSAYQVASVPDEFRISA